jgi:hypothetical protein
MTKETAHLALTTYRMGMTTVSREFNPEAGYATPVKRAGVDHLIWMTQEDACGVVNVANGLIAKRFGKYHLDCNCRSLKGKGTEQIALKALLEKGNFYPCCFCAGESRAVARSFRN